MGGQRHAPAALSLGRIPVTHCTGDCLGPRVGLDGCGKSRPHRDSIPDRPVRSESLYRWAEYKQTEFNSLFWIRFTRKGRPCERPSEVKYVCSPHLMNSENKTWEKGVEIWTIILKSISKVWAVRIGTGGCLLYIWQWTFEFHKRQEIYSLN